MGDKAIYIYIFLYFLVVLACRPLCLYMWPLRSFKIRMECDSSNTIALELQDDANSRLLSVLNDPLCHWVLRVAGLW